MGKPWHLSKVHLQGLSIHIPPREKRDSKKRSRGRDIPILVDELLSESERAGARFVRRLVDEWANGANRFDRPGEALFGAWIGDRLVGVGGLNVDPYARDERVGRVRHLYVLSDFRRLGVARRLMAQIIAAAAPRLVWESGSPW